MRTLSVFNNVSIDGFFTDDASEMSWAHSQDAEWTKFMSTNASGEAELVFGRKTYEMMARFWPSKEAAQAMPEVARGMNRMRKTVFSHTLKAAEWENSRVAQADLATEIRRMKSEPGPNLLILGHVSSSRRGARFPTATSFAGTNHDVPAGTSFARFACCSSTSTARP